MNVAERPRLPLGGASQTVSGSNQPYGDCKAIAVRPTDQQRGSLQVWFDPETVWLAGASGKRGRSATFSDAALQACLTLKALFGLPLPLRADKSETFDCLKFTLEGAGQRSDGNARTPAHAFGLLV